MTSFRQAWRALVCRRAFTLVTVLTLGAGIAVVTTTFSIVNGVLLSPLPYPGAGQLVTVMEASPAHRERASLVAPVRLDDWNRLSRAFLAISASYAENVTDTSGAEPARLAGRRVMPRYFEVFGLAPLAGRTFVADEERFGGPTAVVISEGLWSRRFNRSPAAVGSHLTVGGASFTIVGVMPGAFAAPAIDVWLPAQLAPRVIEMRDNRFLSGVGRIRPGVSLEAARADLARVQAQLGEQFPRTDKDWSVEVRDLKDVRVGDYRRPLLLVFAAVALLFAIAIANVAGLVLVQLNRRTTELAVRAAIGASRAQIVGAVMREVVLIGGLGAAGGGLASIWLTNLAASAFSTIPRMSDVTVDGRALAVAAGSTLLAATIVGLLPAMAATRTRNTLLSSAGRGVVGGRHRLQGAIVVAQLALGVVLAGTAGLLVRSYGALAGVDAGFDATHVLTFHVAAAWDEDRNRVGDLQRRLIAAFDGLPGVRAAGFANFLPASGATLRSQVRVQGLSAPTDTTGFTVGTRTVSAGYLKALGVPLVGGNWCAEPRGSVWDRMVRSAMVNRQFVARFAGGASVVGRQLSIMGAGWSAPYQIDAVVGDVIEDGPASPPAPYVYFCMPGGSWPDPEYVVRTAGDPRAAIAAVREVVKATDSSRPLFAVQPLSAVMDAALDQPRLNARVISTFAVAALALAALGLYGLLMLLVSERRQELGVRIALGAAPRDLVQVVASGAGRLVAVGVAAGLLLTLAAGQLMRSLLFGVAPYDAVAVGGAVLALAAVAVAAALVPALQASRVSAMEAMRT